MNDRDAHIDKTFPVWRQQPTNNKQQRIIGSVINPKTTNQGELRALGSPYDDILQQVLKDREIGKTKRYLTRPRNAFCKP